MTTAFEEQRAQRERALKAALSAEKLAELRAIKAAWEAGSEAPEYSLLDVLGVLIALEHKRIAGK